MVLLRSSYPPNVSCKMAPVDKISLFCKFWDSCVVFALGFALVLDSCKWHGQTFCEVCSEPKGPGVLVSA